VVRDRCTDRGLNEVDVAEIYRDVMALVSVGRHRRREETVDGIQDGLVWRMVVETECAGCHNMSRGGCMTRDWEVFPGDVARSMYPPLQAVDVVMDWTPASFRLLRSLSLRPRTTTESHIPHYLS
jgi:hypothetical protein